MYNKNRALSGNWHNDKKVHLTAMRVNIRFVPQIAVENLGRSLPGLDVVIQLESGKEKCYEIRNTYPTI
jgi:hypothetical protein